MEQCRAPSRTARPILSVVVGILLMPQLLVADIPSCDFHDTVNLTDSVQFANGSYLYEGVLIPAALTGTYDYELLFKDERIAVDTHVRGCVCALRSCIKFCCHPKSEKVEYERECSAQLETDLSYSPYVEVTLNNGSQLNVHVLNEFVVQQGIPCVDSYMLDPADSTAEWELFENGTLLRNYDMAYLSKGDYCFTPHNTDGTFVLSPMNCADTSEASTPDTVNSIAMCISLPFMVLTAMVYLYVRELRNLHGKCLICYLISMSIGNTILTITNLFNVIYSYPVCKAFGFLTYFVLLAAFFWVNVISFDLWHNFRGTKSYPQSYNNQKRFLYYSLYAWGTPTLLTVLVVVLQFTNIVVDDWKAFIDDYCWLRPDHKSTVVYFYSVILLLMLLNIIFFVITSVRIYQVKREFKQFAQCDRSARHFRAQSDSFWLFLRLFIIMGITWLLEVASYVSNLYHMPLISTLFFFTDFCNAAQGIILFILFVCKRKVLYLIKKKWHNRNVDSTLHSFRTKSSVKSSILPSTEVSLTKANSLAPI